MKENLLDQLDGGCLDESTLVRFFGGGLTTDRIVEVERHLDRCAACAALIEEAAPVLIGASGERGWGVPAPAEAGQVLAARYELVALLGSGAAGFVFRARDLEVGTDVAVKILRTERASDPAWLGRFVREVRIARALSHPHLCRIFDLQVADGCRFLVMELARGSLRGELRGGVARDWTLRLGDAEAIASALAAMHDVGVLHRDVKPENVLRLPDGRLVLSDFGLASATPDRSAQTRFVGTPLYMAPEVLAGEPATRASDVWSLAVTVHELMFGTRPEGAFRGVGPRKIQAPRTTGGASARAVGRLLGECLALDPARRPFAPRVLAQLAAIRRGSLLAKLPSMSRRTLLLAAGVPASAIALTTGAAFLSGVRARGIANVPRLRTPGPDLSRRLVLSDAWRPSFASDGKLGTANRIPSNGGFDLLTLPGWTRQPLVREGKDAVISPDGTQVAWLIVHDESAYADEQIWVIDLATGKRRFVGQGGCPSWSRDGRTLFFHDRQNDRIQVCDTATDALDTSTFYRGTESYYPAISPDEQRIAFGGEGAIVVVDRRQRSRVSWPTPRQRGTIVRWDPAGRLLAVGGFHGSWMGIWVLDVDARRTIRVATGSLTSVMWAPDGGTLYYDEKVGASRRVWSTSRLAIDRAFQNGMAELDFVRFMRSV